MSRDCLDYLIITRSEEEKKEHRFLAVSLFLFLLKRPRLCVPCLWATKRGRKRWTPQRQSELTQTTGVLTAWISFQVQKDPLMNRQWSKHRGMWVEKKIPKFLSARFSFMPTGNDSCHRERVPISRKLSNISLI